MGLLASCAQEPHRARPIDQFNDARESDDTGVSDAEDAESDVSSDAVEDVEIAEDVADIEDSVDVPDSDEVSDVNDGDAPNDAEIIDDVVDTDVQDTSDGDTTSGDGEDGDASDGDTTETQSCDRWDAFSDSELRAELSDYVSDNHQYVGNNDSECYRWARNHMYGVEEDGLVIDQPIDVFGSNYEGIYTGRLVPYTRSSASRTPGGFNTEHSWPQSQGAGSLPSRCDIHHLFPSDGTVNSTRSSLDFGETACGPPTGGMCSCCDGGSEVGTSQTSSESVFQVRVERQGDIARAHFYFAVRYNYAIDASEENVLRAWHVADPVVGAGETAPSREQIRNDRIESVQNNRNPFVDCPELVDRFSNF